MAIWRFHARTDMTFTMRRESREEVGHRAWLDTGDGRPLVTCTLIDMSPSGAKLAIDEAAQLPEAFGLRLTRDGHPTISCRVVWRNANALGVAFAKANEKAGR
jgi:PilZ domain-containing protein